MLCHVFAIYLKIGHFIIISKALVSVQCVVEVSVCLVIPIAPDSLGLRARSLNSMLMDLWVA